MALNKAAVAILEIKAMVIEHIRDLHEALVASRFPRKIFVGIYHPGNIEKTSMLFLPTGTSREEIRAAFEVGIKSNEI